MACIFVVLSSEKSIEKGDKYFKKGLEWLDSTDGKKPNAILELSNQRIASYPRVNGTGSPVISDKDKGLWIITTGTWFHEHGYGPCSEGRLLHRMNDAGPYHLSRELNGFFGIITGNEKENSATVVTDLIGSCHLFIRKFDGVIALSDSSLLLASLEGVSLDAVGCQEFIFTGVMYEDRTLYREVKKLGPASIVLIIGGEVAEIREYWRAADLVPESLGEKQAVSRLWDGLVHATDQIGSHYPRPIVDLTGGHDSRAIVSACLGGKFDFSVTVSGKDRSPDVVISRKLAKMMDVPHYYFEPGDEEVFGNVKDAFLLTDGEYNILEYARVLSIHKWLSNRFNISINGSFGEVARGYWWELLFPHIGKSNKLDSVKIARLRYAAHSYEPSVIPPNIRINPVEHFSDVIDRATRNLSDLPNTFQLDCTYLTMRMQRWQGRIASSTNRLWPCISPFIFRDVIETMLQACWKIRYRSYLIRKMIYQYKPEISKVPLEKGHPAMPFMFNNMHQFVPLLNNYSRKLTTKAMNVMRKMIHASDKSAKGIPLSIKLSQIKPIMEPLKLHALKTSSLLDSKQLDKFLEESRNNNFRFSDQLSRMLSMEYALKSIRLKD